MTHPYLQDSEAPPEMSGLDEIQRRFAVEFPREYCRFLLEQNGGVFRQEVVYLEDGDEEDETKWCSVRELYGVSTDSVATAEMGLAFHLTTLRDRIPPQFIPIGRDFGGDQICLGVDDPYQGMVWSWRHERQEADEMGNMSFVCKDFDRFIDGLRYSPDIESEETEPVFQAIETANVDLLRRILVQSMSLESRNEKGFTPLQFASWVPQSNVVELLLRRGSEVESTDQLGRTSLAISAQRGSVDIVSRLLEAGARVDSVDNEGNTPLMHAAKGAVPRVIKRLVAAGADVNAMRPDGLSPLMLCFRNELNRRMLLDAGAKVPLGRVRNYGVPKQVPDEWSRQDIGNAIDVYSERTDDTIEKMVERGNREGHGDQLQEELRFLNELWRRLRELDR